MKTFKSVNVFLASPGDVSQESQAVREILESVNQSFGIEKGVQFRVVNWKTHGFPAYGGDAQSLLNDQIADMTDYELFIGIMWNRFGTPTPRAGSGTEEEFLRAVETLEKTGAPHIMFYFNQAPHSFRSAEEAEQKMKVLSFKKKLETEGLPYEYDGIEDFKKIFRNNIETWLVKQSLQKIEPQHVETGIKKENNNIPPDVVKQTLSDSGMQILLKNGFFLATEVSEFGERNVQLKIPVSNAEQDAVFRSLQPGQFGRQEPIPFAHQNTAGIARVTQAKRISSNGQNFWEMLLVLDENNSSILSEFNINGVSADQIAEMRARYILLDEMPSQTGNRQTSLSMNDGLVKAYVIGANSPVRIEGRVLPDLWKNVNKDISVFLPFARLLSVFHLITSHTCEHVLELTIGPVTGQKVHIKFRGLRRQQYVNAEPFVISFEGDCNLDGK